MATPLDIIATLDIKQTTLETWKIAAELAQAALTTLAIIAGGVWSYFRFIRNRLLYPRAELSHSFQYLELIPGKSLLRVTLKVENRGDVLLPIMTTWTKLSQVMPVFGGHLIKLERCCDLPRDDDEEVHWMHLDTRTIEYDKGTAEIEPGEHESFNFDFTIDSAVQVVHLYSFFKNKKKKVSGWACTTIIELRKEDNSHVCKTSPAESPCS